VQSGQRDSEVVLGRTDGLAFVDPLEHEEVRSFVRHGEHFRDRHSVGRSQPRQAGRFRREEPRWRGGVRLREHASPVVEVDGVSDCDVATVHPRRPHDRRRQSSFDRGPECIVHRTIA
jgi:hypothetical protein